MSDGRRGDHVSSGEVRKLEGEGEGEEYLSKGEDGRQCIK